MCVWNFLVTGWRLKRAVHCEAGVVLESLSPFLQLCLWRALVIERWLLLHVPGGPDRLYLQHKYGGDAYRWAKAARGENIGELTTWNPRFLH